MWHVPRMTHVTHVTHLVPSSCLTLSDIFSWEPALWTLMSGGADVNDDDEVKKSIGIFNSKERLLSLDMKTKVVQHVPRINLSHFNFWILNLNFQREYSDGVPCANFAVSLFISFSAAPNLVIHHHLASRTLGRKDFKFGRTWISPLFWGARRQISSQMAKLSKIEGEIRVL